MEKGAGGCCWLRGWIAQEGSLEVTAEARLLGSCQGWGCRRRLSWWTARTWPHPRCFQGGAPTPFDRNYGTKLGVKAILWMSEKLRAVYRKGNVGGGEAMAGPTCPLSRPWPGTSARACVHRAGVCQRPRLGLRDRPAEEGGGLQPGH